MVGALEREIEMKVYRVHCNGFTGRFLTLAEVQTYIDWLKTMDFNIGEVVEVAVGERWRTVDHFKAGHSVRRETLKVVA